MEEINQNNTTRLETYSAKFFYSRVENMIEVSKGFYPRVAMSACEDDSLENCILHRSTFFYLVKIISSILDGCVQCGADNIIVSFSSRNSDMKFSFSSQGESFQFMKMSQDKELVDRLNRYTKLLQAKFAFQKTLTGIEFRFSIPAL